MTTTLDAGNGYTITIEQIAGSGSPWIVRTNKRFLLFHRRITSDWFLDRDQAVRFAEQLRAELAANGNVKALQQRPPGWTLHRPPR
jgi:hypothetical protein